MINVGDSIPEVYFNFRQDDDWQSLNTRESFAGKRVLIFALPGAFTPTCSSQQLPGYEELYNDFLEAGIDEVYCLSVNDTFVMNAWCKINKDENNISSTGNIYIYDDVFDYRFLIILNRRSNHYSSNRSNRLDKLWKNIKW